MFKNYDGEGILNIIIVLYIIYIIVSTSFIYFPEKN